MTYSIDVRLVRARVNREAVNAVGLTEVECVAVDGRGAVWFAEQPPPSDEAAIREWLTTPDNETLARRAELRAVAESTDDGVLVNGFAILRAFILGDPLPDPVYPSPPNQPADPLTQTVTTVASRL